MMRDDGAQAGRRYYFLVCGLEQPLDGALAIMRGDEHE